jgi:hypothetical protein
MVCSGRTRPPRFEWPVGSDAERSSFVGGSDEPEQQLGVCVIEWREAEFVADDHVVAEQVVDDLPTELSAKAR